MWQVWRRCSVELGPIHGGNAGLAVGVVLPTHNFGALDGRIRERLRPGSTKAATFPAAKVDCAGYPCLDAC